MPLISQTDHGLHCGAGGFFIDPWRPVDKAVVTHAHSDHARRGCKSYLCSGPGRGLLRERVGRDARIRGLPFGESIEINGVKISLHPAGHILGSAQVRVEHRGEVWVVSGDYKTENEPSCEAFEPVRCNVFVTESTFGMPVYKWPNSAEVFEDINNWWRSNRERGLTSIVFAYALGKAQRVLSGLDPEIGPILVHGAVNRFLPLYAEQGIKLPPAQNATKERATEAKGKGIVIAPGSAADTPWLRRFGKSSRAFASGWMMVRGARRRRALDRGFVMSDHADWQGLLDTIDATGAERVGVTHGFTGTLVRYLRERGRDAWEIPTRYTGETDTDDDNEGDSATNA